MTSDLFVIDNVQMLSHGSADLILEACTDFWDGTDIYPLSGSDRCSICNTFHFQAISSIFLAALFPPAALLVVFHLSPLLLQKEGSGFLPACLSVRLLLSICLQTHASILVQPTEWEMCGAGPWSLPVLRCGAARHHPHQTQLMQEQLELRRYELELIQHREISS